MNKKEYPTIYSSHEVHFKYGDWEVEKMDRKNIYHTKNKHKNVRVAILV